MTDAKTCSRCGKLKPFSSFHRNRTRKDGYSNECKPCKNGYELTDAAKQRRAKRKAARKAASSKAIVHRQQLFRSTRESDNLWSRAPEVRAQQWRDREDERQRIADEALRLMTIDELIAEAREREKRFWAKVAAA